MSAINPLDQCRKDFDAYRDKYKEAYHKAFGNKWSDEEIDRQMEAWYDGWQQAFHDGMLYMQNLREDDALVLDDLQK